MNVKIRSFRNIASVLVLFFGVAVSAQSFAQDCYSSEFKRSTRLCDEGEPDLCAFGTAISASLYKDIECLFSRGRSPNPIGPVERASSLPAVIAAEFGDEKVLTLFSRHKVDWEAKDSEEGMTALLWINSYTWAEPEKMRGSYYNTTKFLLENGANVNAQDSEGNTVLMNKSSLGKLDFVKLFLAHKADPNLRNRAGQTALMLADFDPDVVLQLIKSGADINIRDNQGRTAVFYAAEKCFASKVRQLMQAGAEVELTDDEGLTPLIFLSRHADARRKCGRVIEMLSHPY